MNESDSESEMQFLKSCSYSSANPFSLNGYKTWAKVVKVYDGDTFTVIFYFMGKPFRFKIRLADIDTAEKTSNDPNERRYSQLAIEKCKEYISATNEIVYIECHCFDKYGRVLATIKQDPNEADNPSLNNLLLESGLAYRYNGGKKLGFKEWCEFGNDNDNK